MEEGQGTIYRKGDDYATRLSQLYREWNPTNSEIGGPEAFMGDVYFTGCNLEQKMLLSPANPAVHQERAEDFIEQRVA